MKRRIVTAIVVSSMLLTVGHTFNKPYMAWTDEYLTYCQNYEMDITGDGRGVSYPTWWGDEITRKVEALADLEYTYGESNLLDEYIVGYASVFEEWAPGHGGDIIIHEAYNQGYGLNTVDTLKANGLIPADYVHPAAGQQPVAETTVVPETQPQQEQQMAVEQTPQPQTKASNQSDKPVKEESIVEETVESETVVETTESEETTVESTEESVETETTTETAEESSESYETVVEENMGFPVIPVLIGVLIAGLCGAGLYFWKKQKQN